MMRCVHTGNTLDRRWRFVRYQKVKGARCLSRVRQEVNDLYVLD